jgi:uncharacterized protein YdaU (DUF1376 family)
MGAKMNKPPAFQFYADDFLGGTADMTQGEIGAYILLLCHQWNRGSIPVEPERIQMVAKGAVTEHLLEKFPICPDGLRRNARLEQEREKQAEYREKQRLKGIASGISRAKPSAGDKPGMNRGSTVVQPTHQPNTQPEGNSPSPSPSSIIKTPLPPKGEVVFLLEQLPPRLRTKSFQQEFAKWVKIRMSGKRVKDWRSLFAEQLAWMDKKQYNEATAREILSASIRNGWTGLFEPKQPAQQRPEVLNYIPDAV